MKKLILLLPIFLLAYLPINAQSISCQEVLNTVRKNYDLKTYTICSGSSWILKAEYYTLDNVGFVVAYIKDGFQEKPYIFCDVPKRVWDKFKNEAIIKASWGESFHENIMDYKCNCF